MEVTEKDIQEVENLEQEFSSENQTTKINNEENESKNIIVTPVQQDIIKELAKIDIELGNLENVSINEDDFYDKLDDLLTDEWKDLQEENPKKYLKLVDAKKQEFFKNNSNEEKKNILLEQKKDLELKNAIEIGVVEVTAIYKDYNHIEMQDFWNKKLNKEEQDEILNSSNSTTEVFKKTHEKYLEKSGKKIEIKNTPVPNTPDLSKVIKQSIKPTQISEIDSDEEKYKRGLGV